MLLSTVALAAALGLVGAVIMDLPMVAFEEGRTPADAAASVLRRTGIERVDARDAWVVHHGAGVVAGVLAGASFVALRAVGLPAVVAGGAVAAGFTALLYGFFAWSVLPTRGVGSGRAVRIRRQWIPSAAVYGVVVGGGLVVLM
jgi:hypothetical protein